MCTCSMAELMKASLVPCAGGRWTRVSIVRGARRVRGGEVGRWTSLGGSVRRAEKFDQLGEARAKVGVVPGTAGDHLTQTDRACGCAPHLVAVLGAECQHHVEVQPRVAASGCGETEQHVVEARQIRGKPVSASVLALESFRVNSAAQRRTVAAALMRQHKAQHPKRVHVRLLRLAQLLVALDAQQLRRHVHQRPAPPRAQPRALALRAVEARNAKVDHARHPRLVQDDVVRLQVQVRYVARRRVQVLHSQRNVVRDLDALLPRELLQRRRMQHVLQRAALCELHDEPHRVVLVYAKTHAVEAGHRGVPALFQ
mmetsp:Transcript_2129/g.5754  ORF Transcript_2129/g.5754 Transcript_2129/m.5754 type:complete len:313 (-) Transcript_2129:1673-2611(-)